MLAVCDKCHALHHAIITVVPKLMGAVWDTIGIQVGFIQFSVLYAVPVRCHDVCPGSRNTCSFCAIL